MADTTRSVCATVIGQQRSCPRLRGRPARDRAAGAVAWKPLLGIAAGIGAVWFFARSSLPPPEATTRAVSGPIAMRSVVPNNEPRVAAAPATPVAAARTDPFAGVDLNNDSVLRHIAGIDESARNRAQRALPRGAAAASAARTASEAPRPVPAPPVVSARPEPDAPQRPAPNPAAEAAAPPPAQALPVVDSPRAPAVLQTSAVDPPVVRSGAEAVAATAPPLERPLVVPAAPPAADTERTQVAALGTVPSAPLATTAPLRVIARPAPPFPIEAMRAGVQQGRVVARLTVEADGRVSGAQIISATPLGYFERESRRALVNWRYEPPGRRTSADVELVFNLE